MTAEIAILNKSAVALAADSKVTIGTGGGRKTFDTVNKLFTLSKVHPVGIMVFGNAEFMQFPWETIVKLYRSSKKSSSYTTVAAWAQDFLKYIRGFGNIQARHRSENVAFVVDTVLTDLTQEVSSEARHQKIRINSSQFITLFKEKISDKTKALPQENVFSNTYMVQFRRTYGRVVTDTVDLKLGRYNDRNLIKLATDYLYKFLQRKTASSFSSGIVIAGFGDNEVFPSLVYFETDGYVGSRIKIYQEGNVSISVDSRSCLIPFAQGEMVNRFMDGIDPEYSEFLHTSFYNILTDNCLSVLDKYGSIRSKTAAASKRAIRSAVNRSWIDLVKNAELFQRRYFSRPIVDMIALLPKDELPHLAESLVALTSLKRHVSRDAETVGGPMTWH